MINEAMVSPLVAMQVYVLVQPIIATSHCLFELSCCPVIILTNSAQVSLQGEIDQETDPTQKQPHESSRNGAVQHWGNELGMCPLKPAPWLKQDERNRNLCDCVIKLQMRSKFEKCKVMTFQTWRKGKPYYTYSAEVLNWLIPCRKQVFGDSVGSSWKFLISTDQKGKQYLGHLGKKTSKNHSYTIV